MNLHELYDGTEYGLFAGARLWHQAPPKQPLIEHLLYERDVICISSKPGVGKSVLAQQLMCCLTTGKPFLDTYPIRDNRPCNVLYVQTEGDRAETLERLTMMKATIGLDDTRWLHINVPGIAFNIDSEFNQFMGTLSELDMIIDVIIIDPLYTTVKGDMSRNDVVTDWIRNIRKLKGWLDCAIIVLNHEGKDIYNEGYAVDRGASTIFGSTFWAAFFNSNYRLKTFDGHHLLEVGKNRSGKGIDVLAMKMLTEETLLYIPYDPALTDNWAKIIGLLRGGTPLPVRKLVEVTGVSRATTYRVLKNLEGMGKIVKEMSTKEWVYRWISTENE